MDRSHSIRPKLDRRPLLVLAALLLLPVGASAQIAGSSNSVAVAAEGYAISVRDLGIPPSAREAFLDGNRRLAGHDFSGGAAQFRRAIARFPSYYEAYFFLGVAEINLHHQRNAEEAFRKSIELSSGGYAPAHFGLGLVLCDEKKFEEAGATVGVGLYIDDESWAGYYAMGRAFFGMNRLEEAESSVREGIARKSDLPEAYLLLADIHGRQQNQSAVIDDLDHYIAVNSDSVTRERAEALRDHLRHPLSFE